MSRFLVLFFAVVYFFCETAMSQSRVFVDEDFRVHKTKTRPTIGLVLGGGGARGLSHIGVIKALEDNHIPIDVIAGTSMGAIIGSLYASGYTADELVEISNELDWGDMFNDKTSRSRSSFRRKSEEFGFLTKYKITFNDGKLVLPRGIIQGQNLFLELSRLLAHARTDASFDDLPIPFRPIATDLSTGEPVVMKSGDLATAVFASMAIPGLIPPVEREGKYLVDGGLSNNVPVNIAREMGADIVIVVNVGTNPKPVEEISSFIEVLRQTQIILTKNNTEFQIATMNTKDMLVIPKLEGLSAASFDKVKELVAHGQDATHLLAPSFANLQLNDAAWQAHLNARQTITGETPLIDEVRILQNSKLSDDVLKRAIRVNIGEPLDLDRVNTDIVKLYGDDVFSRITYEVLEEDGQHVLEVSAVAKESSEGYYKVGIKLDSNFSGESDFKLGFSYTKPLVNKFGGEWRTEVNIGDNFDLTSEYYQPIGARRRFFVEPSFSVNSQKTDFFDEDDRKRGKLKSEIYGASLQGGMLFGTWGEFRTGLTLVKAELDFSDSSLGFEQINIRDTSMLAQFSIDTLDSISFPTKGEYALMSYANHNDILGGELNFNSWSIVAFKARTKGQHTLTYGAQANANFGRDANALGPASLGGFRSLSGFSEDELSGRYSGVVSAQYLYRLNQQAPLFDAPIFIGGTIEAGNVFQSLDNIGFDDLIYAGSVYAGLKSPMGPIYLGVGYNDTGATSIYFSLGSFF
ncbi:MAG: hypothetical protein COA43_08475 [Robiginitomaculum sp.]|nr:MAG: hypothetical protein COA43_08475 [Robiginitomaculum sp.]